MQSDLNSTLTSAPVADISMMALPPAILFGRDDRHRPHASAFAADAREGAEAAAKLMGMHLLVAEEEPLKGIAARLPAGRLFESGRAFVPFVKAELYDRLVALSGAADIRVPAEASKSAAEGGRDSKGGKGGPKVGSAAAGAPVASPGSGATKRPTTWDEIGIGSLVLMCSGPPDGWYEAVVVHTKADDAFELRWRDWPDEPLETRKRDDLGLMPPNPEAGLR